VDAGVPPVRLRNERVGESRFFCPVGARPMLGSHPRLTPWALILRRFAASRPALAQTGSNVQGLKSDI
jgi:hypothetical protein